jgi:hypothetical protein
MDLRPYFFVTKDRKNYFGAATVLGHLASIIELLLGPKISIQAREEDIKRLSPDEANSAFEQIRSHIISNDDFENEPDGIAGLSLLVKTHPTLQANHLDFLEMLPAERLGFWVVKGWSDIIKDVAMEERFQKLIERWSTVPRLKAVIASAAKIQNPKGR